MAGIRQILETVYDKLFNAFGLWRERPHELSGLRARLAARVALHNFCIWLNGQLGRPRLAFADLLGWCSRNPHQAFKGAPDFSAWHYVGAKYSEWEEKPEALV